MKEGTKVTSASVRVMLSFQYCNFEGVQTIENPNGIDQADIEETRKNVQIIATNAVAEFKANPITDPQKELIKVQKKLDDIKNHYNKETASVLPRQE